MIGGFRKRIILAVMLGLLGLLGLCTLNKFGYQLAWTERLALNLAAFFSVGCCFYIFRDRIRFIVAGAALSAGILFIAMFSYRGHQLVFALAGAYLLFFMAFSNIPPLASFGALPDVSYGEYLYGWPIQKLIIWWFPGTSPWVVFLVSALLSVVAGWISWHVVEKRFLISKPLAVKQLPAALQVRCLDKALPETKNEPQQD